MFKLKQLLLKEWKVSVRQLIEGGFVSYNLIKTVKSAYLRKKLSS